MKCPSCGADLAPADSKCPHCGSHRPSAQQTSKQAVFAKIMQSPEYANRDAPERLEQLPKVSAFQKIFLQAFFLVFVGMSGFMAIFLLGMAGVVGLLGFGRQGAFAGAFSLGPLLMSAVPIAFVFVGIKLFRHFDSKLSAMEKEPVETLPAIVTGKRTHVSQSGNSQAGRTSYYITCETEDGSRQEYPVWDGKLYGKVSDRDAGILFLRAGYGLDFDRVPT